MSKPLIAVLISIALIVSLVSYIALESSSHENKDALYAVPLPMKASIEPRGPIELKVGQTQVFTVNVSSLLSTDLVYSWAVENSSTSMTVMNGTDYLLLAYGNQAVFKFKDSNADFCSLSSTVVSGTASDKATVTVVCDASSTKSTEQQNTNSQSSQQTPTQNQNYYTTNVYSDSASFASYIVKPDGLGQYIVINGTDGSTIAGCTSTSANQTINNALALGGIITMQKGDYSGAMLKVPSDVQIIAETGVLGIKYASIADGARIDEPSFNDAFGRYNSGTYTISTNGELSATNEKWYLAFKPDNSIYFASTNASFVINSVLENADLTYGAKIVFDQGHFDITNDCLISTTATIEGSSGGTYFSVKDNVNLFRTTKAIIGLTMQDFNVIFVGNGTILKAHSGLAHGTFENINAEGVAKKSTVAFDIQDNTDNTYENIFNGNSINKFDYPIYYRGAEVIVTNCKFGGADKAILAFSSTGHITVSNCQFEQAGITLYNSCDYIINNVWFSRAQDEAINILDSNNGTISNFNIESLALNIDPYGYGISISSSKSTLISNGIISSGGLTSQLRGINEDASDNTLISNVDTRALNGLTQYPIYLCGLNSHATNSYNGTIWLP